MKIVKDFVLREIAGEQILIPVGETIKEFHGMVSLTETGKFVWENLEKVDDIRELVAMMVEEYDVSEEDAFSDTARFILKLRDLGFIEPTREDQLW